MAVKLRKRLGDLLVEEQIIAEADLTSALQRQSLTGRKLGDTLIEMGILMKIRCSTSWQDSWVCRVSIST